MPRAVAEPEPRPEDIIKREQGRLVRGVDATLEAQAAPLGLRVEAPGAGSATRHVYRGSARLFSGRPGQIEDFLSGYQAALTRRAAAPRVAP